MPFQRTWFIIAVEVQSIELAEENSVRDKLNTRMKNDMKESEEEERCEVRQ